MYEIIETATLTGGYDLQAMASKIDAMYAADRLTADEWQKLRKLCLDHLRPEDTRPELQQQLEAKVEKHNQVVERTALLEEKMKVANHRLDDLEESQKG